LDPLDESLVLLSRDILPIRTLAKKGDDRNTRMSTNNGDLNISRVDILDLSDETRCSDDIESRNTEDPAHISDLARVNRRVSIPLLFVKDTLLLEHLGEDRDGRVDGVGDDADHGFWAVLRTCRGQVTDDRGVGVLGNCYQPELRVRASRLSSRRGHPG